MEAIGFCAECGEQFQLEDMIRYGNAYLCAKCKPIFLQKLAEGAEIQTAKLRFASFGRRLGAYLLDGVILGIPAWVLIIRAGFPFQTDDPTAFVNTLVALSPVSWIVNILYETLLVGKYGATLGKMAFKMKVVTATGDKVSYLRALGRHFAKLINSLTLMIGFLIAAFDDERRALHDRICDTRVVLK